MNGLARGSGTPDTPPPEPARRDGTPDSAPRDPAMAIGARGSRARRSENGHPHRRPGRPRGPGTSREAILRAARAKFADLGYDRATIRGIAAAAGVDARMVTHYFRTKQHLFLEVVEPPIDPAGAIPGGSHDMTPEEIGFAVARYLVAALESEDQLHVILAVIRSASSEPDVVPLVRTFVTERVLLPVASQVTADRPHLRAALIGSQIVGLVYARHLVGIDALAQADPETLVRALAPVITHYLTGDLG